MKTLKTLTLAALPVSRKDPTLARRIKLIAHLEEQKLLAINPQHVRVVQKWIIQDNGIKSSVELKKRIRPWWRSEDGGDIYLRVRYGARALELEKGKPAVLVKDKSRLVSTIDTIIAAVKAGELDDHLTQQATLRVAKPVKQRQT